jgi:hypothetical protein
MEEEREKIALEKYSTSPEIKERIFPFFTSRKSHKPNV